MTHTTLHRKIKVEQHEPNKHPGLKSGVNMTVNLYMRGRGRRGNDRMVDRLTTTYALFHHYHCNFEYRRGVLDTTLRDKVFQ